MVGSSLAGNIEDHVLDFGLGSVEDDIARCSSWKEAFVDMGTVQRYAKARLPNNRSALAFVGATVVEAFRHGVPDRLAFEPHESLYIQLDGV